MAVEARHLNLFPPQFIRNREIMSAIEGRANIYSYCATPIGNAVPDPLSGTSTTETLQLPMYTSAIAKTADSGLTAYTTTLPVSRKRSRDSTNPFMISFPDGQNQNNDHNNHSVSHTFVGEDISLQIQHQQLEIDHLLTQHTEKLRMEIEERGKRNLRRIMAALEEGMGKRLRAKEEEIEKMGKLNWALEESVKSLYMENQMWRDLAHSNEATANSLRTNLEHVLRYQNHHLGGAGLDESAAPTDYAQSCCGSNYNGGGGGGDEEEEDGRTLAGSGCDGGMVDRKRWCRKCGKEESCVLVLPCRHLCLCTVCGSSVQTCPICNSNNNATVHVNMSPS
ncbi:probable BOI-related E3 ubiquitin-protein ligase 2 [Cornus florida]|uniref:probable BOI-related E3 ubiquitin-protein ligase 2 n=1 Tax=Cornus florida TaxID=4283 RepID=UPI00289EBDC4|nr:probable BOI-related E3 ubiquitin-protein ligase 2 [Cornus florida]